MCSVTIPLKLATDEAIAKLKQQGCRITGHVINGIACLIVKGKA